MEFSKNSSHVLYIECRTGDLKKCSVQFVNHHFIEYIRVKNFKISSSNPDALQHVSTSTDSLKTIKLAVRSFAIVARYREMMEDRCETRDCLGNVLAAC